MDPMTDIKSIKEQLEFLTTNYEEQFKGLEEKAKKFSVLEDTMKSILSTKKNEIITLNVGGTKFQTRLSTLLSQSESLFQVLITQTENLDEIFIDRSPELFSFVLDFLRTGVIQEKRLKKDELFDAFLAELTYYGLTYNSATFPTIAVNFVGIEVNSYASGSLFDVATLHNKDLSKYILVNSPGRIIIEFAGLITFDRFEIGGIKGNSEFEGVDNCGKGATIYSSKEKTRWKTIGTLPPGWNTSIQQVKVKASKGKYLKFEHTSTKIGIGYLNIIPIK